MTAFFFLCVFLLPTVWILGPGSLLPFTSGANTGRFAFLTPRFEAGGRYVQPSTAARAGTAAARVEHPVPFQPGETLTYDISWSMFVMAGTASVTVQEKKSVAGSSAYYVVAEGEPTPLIAKLYTLHYKVDTLLDAYTLLPHVGTVVSREGERTRTKETRFDRRTRTATYEVRGANPAKRQAKVPPEARDPLSAFLAVRTLPMRPGTTQVFPIYDNGETFNVRVTVQDRETVTSGLGTTTAWKVVPVILDAAGQPSSRRAIQLWISDDERRLPLKIEAGLEVGTFNVTLRQVSKTGARG